MTTVRVGAAILLGLVLLLPAASAATARGDLTAQAAHLSDDAILTSPGLDALSVADAPPALILDLTDVALQRIGSTTVRLGGPAPVSHEGEQIDERASYPAARITLAAGEGEQRVALRTLGAATAQVPTALLRGVAGALLGTATSLEEAGCAEGSSYCLDVFGVYEIAAPRLQAELSGDVVLLLHGPTLILEADGERTSFSSGTLAGQDAAGVEQTEDTWVVLRGRADSGSLAGPDVQLFSPSPTLRTSSIAFPSATGALRVGAMEYRAKGDAIEARGDILLLPAPVERAADHDGGFAYAPGFTTRVQGDIASISLRGAPAFLDSAAEKAGVAAILALVLAGIMYAWQHLVFAAATLYTRLQKPDILDNDVRNRIYDIIRETPGISAREVHRRSDQSWGTVVYHLRQLERHHLVVSRSVGRTRNYYENHGKYRGMEVQLACLQSPRARALAHAIVARPGITQEQLAEGSGFPQPTTSYYVRKLKQAGLVEELREGRFARYTAHAELPRFLAISDHAPTLGQAAASGVQA